MVVAVVHALKSANVAENYNPLPLFLPLFLPLSLSRSLSRLVVESAAENKKKKLTRFVSLSIF